LEDKNQKLEIEGQGFAEQIVENFGTNDVFVIAEKAGVKIIYESWFPVTIGEYNRKNKLICVNLNAEENREKIIAHELGHFFAQELSLDKAEEENFCHEFARSLSKMQLKISLKGAEDIKKNKNCKS